MQVFPHVQVELNRRPRPHANGKLRWVSWSRLVSNDVTSKFLKQRKGKFESTISLLLSFKVFTYWESSKCKKSVLFFIQNRTLNRFVFTNLTWFPCWSRLLLRAFFFPLLLHPSIQASDFRLLKNWKLYFFPSRSNKRLQQTQAQVDEVK